MSKRELIGCLLAAVLLLTPMTVGLFWVARSDARMLDEAHREGYEAASSDIPAWACQYSETTRPAMRERWLAGWQRYQMERGKR